MRSLIYDGISNDPKSAFHIGATLRYFPPLETEDGDLPTSGLDCLTQVIRHIYSHSMSFEHVLRQDVDDGEGDNPLLKYAWQSMQRDGDDGAATEEQKTEQAAQKQAVLKHMMGSRGFLRGGIVNFTRLSTCQFMDKTLWGRNEFVLYLPVFQKTNTAPEWHMKPGGNREDAGADGLLRFNCRSTCDDDAAPVSLQSFVDGNFGPRVGMDGNPELWLCGLPSIVRILYTPSRESPLPLQSLRTFQLPIADSKRRTEGDDVPIVVKRVTYVILAVVRHGLRPRDLDYVRTYDLHGAQVRLLHKPPTIVDDSWSIEHNTGHTYSLFYMAYPAGVSLSRRLERQVRRIPEPPKDLANSFAALTTQQSTGASDSFDSIHRFDPVA